MADFTDYLENAIINHVFRNTSFTSPTAVYVGLFTTTPTADAGTGGTEVSGGGYARQAVTFGAPSAGSTSNSADVTFPTATADWGTINGFGIWDAASGGNLLAFESLTTPKTIGSGDTARFAAGDLTLSID